MSSLADRAAVRLRNNPPPPAPAVDPDTALLRLAGEVRNEHALIIGPNALELMCGLIRRGAAEVSLLRYGVRPERASVDLAVATEIGSPEQALPVVAHARRALTASGRLIVRTTADSTGRLAKLVAQMLRLNGFSAVRARRAGDRTLVTGVLPWFGPLPPAPSNGRTASCVHAPAS
jgi:hypothetical protein